MAREWYAPEPEPIPAAPGSDAVLWKLYASKPSPVDDWGARDEVI